jgi:hypothetical protein
VNYARCQQQRRLVRAGRLGLASVALAASGAFVVSLGAVSLGAMILVVAGDAQVDRDRRPGSAWRTARHG